MSGDPFYNRKPVPDELIEYVAPTGLTAQEEVANRERKFSVQDGDLRNFANPKNKDGKFDPYYSRKPVPDAMIKGVGETGLSVEQEFENRERKYSVNGVDVRKFGNSATSGLEPQADPYYGRKAVDKAQIQDVGETGMSKAEEFETRENKAALFDLSNDPFQLVSGKGHRASIAGGAIGAAAGEARRRSSAAAPHASGYDPDAKYHSGYAGDENNLAPIESRHEDITPSTTTAGASTTHTNSNTGQAHYYDNATVDPDSVAPHEIR